MIYVIIIAAICSIVLIASFFPSQERKKIYDADFAPARETLQKSTANDNGFCIGNRFTSIKESHSHLICIGGSGSQKSTTFCYTTLLQSHNFSFVIHDCSKELFNGTAAALSDAGYEILVLDYAGKQSEGFNFFNKCRSYEDISKMINVIMKNSLEGNPDYWSQSAEATVTFFAKALWAYAPSEYKNLPNTLHMLNVFSYAPEKVDKWIINTKDIQIINEYKGICATPSKTLQSSLSTAKTVLSIYSNPNIQKITSFDTIEFERFRKKKTALYICNSPGNAHYYRSISASLIQSFFDHILEKIPDKNSLSLMFILDEVAVMRINALPSFLSLARKYSVSVATLWQDYNQIEHLFGKYEAANIFTNSKLKVFMPSSKPLETCVMLEKLLGKFQFIDDKGIIRTRELLTVQELYQLNKILVLNGNAKPVLLDVNPFYKQKKLRRLSELPVFQPKNNLPIEVPPLIPFD